MKPVSNRNASLDTLRMIAILAVFAHHALPNVMVMGDRGVDLFFVLSGYLIGGIILSRVDATGTIAPFSFWRDRWMRTIPAYYAALLVYVIKELVDGGNPLGTFWPYVIFVQSYVAGSAGLPRFHHSWSLCVEEHFYLVLPLVFAVAARVRRPQLGIAAVLAIGTTLLVVRTVIVAHGGWIQIKLSHWRTDALVIGVLLAYMDRAPSFRSTLIRHRALLVALSVVTLAFAAWVDLRHNAFFEFPIAVACGCLVALGVSNLTVLEVCGRTRVVRWVARISYSLYLVHTLVVAEVMKRMSVSSGLGVALTAVVSLMLSLVVAELLYSFVELPGLRLRERLRVRAAKKVQRLSDSS